MLSVFSVIVGYCTIITSIAIDSNFGISITDNALNFLKLMFDNRSMIESLLSKVTPQANATQRVTKQSTHAVFIYMLSKITVHFHFHVYSTTVHLGSKFSYYIYLTNLPQFVNLGYY